MNNRNTIISINILSTIVLQGLAFFSGPIFSRLLGPDNYGITSVYLTWVQLAATILTLQAGGTLAIARSHFPMDEQRKFQSSVLSLASLSYCIFSVIIVCLVWVIQDIKELNIIMVLFGLAHGWGYYCVSFLNLKFTYEFEPKKNFVLSSSVSILTILLSIYLINQCDEKLNYWGRIAGQSIVYFIYGLLIYLKIFRNGHILYNKDYWSFTLPIAIPTIFHLLAGLILNQSDRVMLQNQMGNYAAGIYALAASFSAVISTLWNALNNSWVPFYYEYTRENQVEEMKRHARNYTELFTILVVGFILLSKEVFHVYAKQDFWEGTDLIPLFSIGYYFVFLYGFPANYEFYNKKTTIIAVGTSSAAICNIILNYFYIRIWGIQGAVVATAISHGLQFIFHYFCAKRIRPGEFPFKLIDFAPGLIAVCLSCVFYWATRDNWLIRWGLGIAIGINFLIKIVKRREIF